jgi:CHAT domain-containing protein
LHPDAPLVLVPTDVLHGLPWSALASLAGRAVTITPSASLWMRPPDAVRATPTRRVALIAGPGLEGATREVRDLAGLYPDATVLDGPRATAAATLAALEGADLAHLAAHGTFRADSPLFSALTLADGHVTVYELERLRSIPSVMVLPACDAATVGVHAGDELLGAAAALLGLGVRSVIAPILPVPDEATADLMIDLHHVLRAGLGPAAALTQAAAAARARDRDVDLAAVGAFQCIGCDDEAADAPPPTGRRRQSRRSTRSDPVADTSEKRPLARAGR